MATVKPKNNQQMRTVKYIGAKSWNNTYAVITGQSSFIDFKSSYLNEYFNKPQFQMFLTVFNCF